MWSRKMKKNLKKGNKDYQTTSHCPKKRLGGNVPGFRSSTLQTGSEGRSSDHKLLSESIVGVVVLSLTQNC